MVVCYSTKYPATNRVEYFKVYRFYSALQWRHWEAVSYKTGTKHKILPKTENDQTLPASQKQVLSIIVN